MQYFDVLHDSCWYTTGMRFERAVVVGAGMGGLLAAAALHENCDEVAIVDKDLIPSEPVSRRGVPQDEQLHNLLTRAQVHIEELLPGFCESLRQKGAGDAAVSTETHVYELGIQMPERDLGLRLMSAWRPVIEHVARTKLLEAGNISIKGLVKASGLVMSQDQTLSGLKIESGDGNQVIEAPVVVDATGMGSSASRWLREHELEEPSVESQKVGQWYVSMLVERPPESNTLNDFWLTFPTPPNTRGALVSPVGPDKWYVSVSGRSNDPPPRSYEELLTYATSLEDLSIAEMIKNAIPGGEPHYFGKPTATWRRYDQIVNPLPGFLPIADSIASLNPLFGQGVSIAAWQAAGLKELLGRNGPQELLTLTRGHLRQAAGACAAAWALGKLTTFESETLTPNFSQKLARAVQVNAEIHRKYVGVWHLIEPLESLADPVFVAQVEKSL